VDYDHLCGGSVSPAAVARAVVRVAASRGVGDVGGGGRLDAARVRRMVDGADEAIRACV
jgi:hypothetical protein